MCLAVIPAGHFVELLLNFGGLGPFFSPLDSEG